MRKIQYMPEYNFPEGNKSEMTIYDRDFLGYLLSNYRPRKVLEIGVASGGTSVLLLKNTNADTKIYGIDIAQNWYKDKTKEIGFRIGEFAGEEQSRYTLFKGVDVVECIEQIGHEIDFCLLDTVHTLPGELLQFLIVLPFLKKGAVVAMHDISLNFHPALDVRNFRNHYATRLLFCTTGSHKKMLPDVPFCNIGAFEVDDSTYSNINITFFALGLTWNYFPHNLIDKYRQFINTHYNKFCQETFEKCVHDQLRLFPAD